VDKGVKLEVLDWGGSGRPLFLLAGLGNTAHVFDSIAPKFTGKYHVYGITRRGFGLSSALEPTEDNYGPDRLADDDLAVLHALGIKRALFAGHSIAGQELSSIASRHPGNVIGLIYLDSAYDYAYFYAAKDVDAARWDGLDLFIPMLRRDLSDLPSASPAEAKRLIPEMKLLLPRLEAGLANYQPWPQPPVRMRGQRIQGAILASARPYPGNRLPVLAIYALPKKCDANCNTSAQTAADLAFVKAFAVAHPNAHVIRWPNAEHYIFRTQQDDVVREMLSFMDGVH
jgi:pimeloyl-ACP methyl ester carboxylesterase